jgi:uncharacterized membrane protein YesL
MLWRINVFFEWIMLLSYLNILWLVFTVLGLGVLGFMPSTVAMYHITRKWGLGERDFSIFQTFLSVYKQEFWRVQILGTIYATIGFLLIFNIHFFSDQNIVVAKYIFIGLFSVYLISLLFLFPTYVHYEMKLMDYIKSTLIMASGRIFHGILLFIGCLLIVIISIKFAGLLLFLMGSVIAMWVTWGNLNWIVE